MKKLNVKNLKSTVSKEELRKINGGFALDGGGFPCFCNGKFLGNFTNPFACINACC